MSTDERRGSLRRVLRRLTATEAEIEALAGAGLIAG